MFLSVCVFISYVNWRITKNMFHSSASRFMLQNFYPKAVPREGVWLFATQLPRKLCCLSSLCQLR